MHVDSPASSVSKHNRLSPEIEGRAFSYNTKPPARNSVHTLYAEDFNHLKRARLERQKARLVPVEPYKVLDAPELMDDYYLNLLDWGRRNVISVALGATCYLYDVSSESVNELTSVPENDYVSCVRFDPSGRLLALASGSGRVELWDVEKQCKIRSLCSLQLRAAAMDWGANVLSVGQKDGAILNHDIRMARSHASTFLGHTEEVCGMRWNSNGSTLATGGNDNRVCIWQPGVTSPLHVLEDHVAAVKAVAWNPHTQDVLATGGGTNDKTIRIWDTTTGANLQTVATESQVCSLNYSLNYNELVSTHGYVGNQIILWKCPELVSFAAINAHESRVLHATMSPCGEVFVSGAADECLKFWRFFGKSQRKVLSARG